MATKTTGKRGEIQNSAPSGLAKRQADLRDLITRSAGHIRDAVPAHMKPERLARIATTAVSTTPELAQCSQYSFVGAMLTAAQLGLEPNTPLGHCYLIPRRMKGAWHVTFVLGYQGMIELVRRSGGVSGIWAQPVYEKDHFEFEIGASPVLKHRPAHTEEDRGNLVAAYAVARTGPGPLDTQFEVATKTDLKRARMASDMGKNNRGPWKDHEAAMAQKTAIRRLFKWLPKTAEIASGVALDARADDGRSQAHAYDSTVTDALLQEGLDAPGEQWTEDGELIAGDEPAAAEGESDG